jgi:hypothetical protein
VAYRGAKKPPKGFFADTDSSNHCPCRRLCAADVGNRVWALVSNLLGPLGTEVGNLLERLGIGLFGAYLVANNPLFCPANSSMGFRAANPTSATYFRTALGDRASIEGTVLG